MNGVQGGRSFFLRPSGKRFDLGDFFELWLGLFQSTVLGDVPYLNVDVSHKAFPRAYANLVDSVQDAGGYVNNQLDPRLQDSLSTHLRGMDICYNMPGNAGRKMHKFIKLDAEPGGCFFRTGWQSYFRSGIFPKPRIPNSTSKFAMRQNG